MPVDATIPDPSSASDPTWKADHLDPWIADVSGTIATLEAGNPGDWVNVRTDAGATGDGATDDTTAIASAITSAGTNGVVYFPKPASYYKITDSLTPLAGQTWRGPGWQNAAAGAIIRGAGAFACVEATSNLPFFTMEGLSFSGHSTASGSKGVYATDAEFWHIRDCSFNQFADQIIHISSGVAGVFERLYLTGGLLVRSGRAAYVGVIDIGTHDPILSDVEANASCTAVGDGFIAGIVVRGVNGFMRNCVGEISEQGIVLVAGAANWSCVGNRADLNWGHGWLINGSESSFVGNRAYRNGRETDDTYDGFQINNHGNTLVGNTVAGLSGDTNRQRIGFLDQSDGSAGAEFGNRYVGNTAQYIRRTLYYAGSSNKLGITDPDRQQQRTLTTATTLNYADQTVLADASGGAFSLTLPTAAGVTGKRFVIKRTSASGNVTVDPDGSETIDGASTKVLGSQYATVTIESNGTNWSLLSSLGTVT